MGATYVLSLKKALGDGQQVMQHSRPKVRSVLVGAIAKIVHLKVELKGQVDLVI